MSSPKIDEVLLSEISFDEVIYPRKDHDPQLVQRYAAVIEEIESQQKYISVSTDNKLLDGKHLWLAYRKANEENGDLRIKVFRYDVSSPHEQLKLACELNSAHGWQLTEADKKLDAIALHSYGCSYEEIGRTLSVGKAKVTSWLSRTVKEEKDRQIKRIFEMWMSCHTLEGISSKLGVPKQTVCDAICPDRFLETKSDKSLAEHATEFEPPIYDIWRQQVKSDGSSHFGNTEVRWLDNLLYLYTNPFDVVVDPFGGGGSTIDICRKRFRRYLVSDRKPIVERETEIRQHDLIQHGKVVIPKPPQWKEVKLVYLDPPYWKQAEGQYSDNPTDLANMSLEDFTESLACIIKAFARKLKSSKREGDAHIALIISPTQWKSPNRQFTDHIGDIKRAVYLPIDHQYSAPYESQQCTAQMVEWAKESRRCLVLRREIIVWKAA